MLGIVLDTETTGLDANGAEVIQLAMVKFTYSPDDEVLRVVDTFDGLQEPKSPIPTHITRLTGITDEMIAGKSIDPLAVESFVAGSSIIIAHQARFDRVFVEGVWPIFKTLYWACSMEQVPWRENGFEGTKLAYLLAHFGLFHDGHRAGDDCRALLHILASPLGDAGKPVLATLLANAREATIRVFAVDAPYDRKDDLKARNYRWCDGSNGARRCWWKDIAQRDHEAELAYLRASVYRRQVDLPTTRITARERYSKNLPR